jgi:hypothetical protein
VHTGQWVPPNITALDFLVPGREPVRYYLASDASDMTAHRLAIDTHETAINQSTAVPFGAVIVRGFHYGPNSHAELSRLDTTGARDLNRPLIEGSRQ